MQSNATELKFIFFVLAGYLSWFFSYLNISVEVFSIFSFLLVIDFITGVVKASTLGHRITSNKAKYGVLSKFSLILIPIVVALGAKGVGKDAGDLFVWGMNLLILSEVYSIIGNVYAIRTKKELPEWDVISILGKRIRDTLGAKDV